MRFRVSATDLIIFIIFCIALLILSSLAVLNVTSLLTSTEFYGLNFFMGFTKDYIAATLIVFAAVLSSIFYSGSSYIFEREKGKGSFKSWQFIQSSRSLHHRVQSYQGCNGWRWEDQVG